ncbi:Transcription activator like [Heracleum sosnowskyi]|uniref:Transcription activator like n=1 Tax=Heracleum sosnowskyi TaxID=360622 RepID=A0AAD8N419_9APIA|nr:Transcription activator like [Heracleum sosnowskyi]
MRDFPSCFGENGVQVADTSSCSSANISKSSQNLVTCTYQCKLVGKSCLICVSWSKNLMGHCLGVEISDLSNQCLCRVDVKPSLFSKRKGFKCLDVSSCKIDLYWDLSKAKFGSGPEPLEGFYVGIVCKGEMVLLVGDLRKEALKKTGAVPSLFNSIFVSKKEHLYGKKVYGSKAQFTDNGQIHNIVIECDANGNDDLCLIVRVDSKPVMKVKHLRWKFRGNYTILVDGLPVEIFWDVHNWLFGTTLGNAIFMFQTCLSAEKLWNGETFLDGSEQQWPCLQSFKESKVSGLGFCLTLYAWKNE